MVIQVRIRKLNIWADPERGGSRESGHPPTPAGKLQMAKGFLRNIGMDPVKKQMSPFGSNRFLSEVRTALCEILL